MERASDNEIKADILHAIKNHELILYYQPQFSLVTSTFEGVEALVRWQHPKKGLLTASDFMPQVEDTPFIVLLGEWVLKTACKQNKIWQDKGLPPMRMAINVSERQFRQPNFVEFIMKVLQETRLKPKYLELELNENIIIHDDDNQLIQVLHRLDHLGLQIALDDFGTGFTSISSLRKIPIHRIKIDRTYISNISNSPEDAAIVKAIIALATSLGMQVVAEGVESLNELKMLLQEESIQIQGFYFSEPLPAEEVEKLLNLHQNT